MQNSMSILFIGIIILVAIILMLIIKQIKDRILVSRLNHYRYKIAIEALKGAIWEWHEQYNILYISSRMREVLETDEVIDTFEKAKKYIAIEDREHVAEFFRSKIQRQDKNDFRIEFTLISSYGKRIIFECRGKGILNTDNIYYLSGALIDITEEKIREQILRSSEKNYRLALDGSQDIMFYCNLERDKMIFNNRIEELINLECRDTHIISIQQWVNSFVINEDKKAFMDEYKKVKDGQEEYFSLEYRMEVKGKRVIWVNTKGKSIVEGNERNIYGSISNINDRKEKEMKIYYMSHYDEVTSIANRRYFEEKVANLLLEDREEKQRMALIFIDIDNFKFVNDTYGHQTGDEMLVMFSNKLKELLDCRCLIARFGGDEFIISMENISDKSEVEGLLNKIIKTFNVPFHIDGKELLCTVSIGVSMLEQPGGDLKTALKHADIAMYKAKTNGKNQYYYFNDEMEKQLKRELGITAGLRRAAESKEIYFDFQLKYWCDGNRVQGVECLARWNTSKLGYIPPAEFIPLAEDSGMIVQIGKYLMEDAFSKFATIKKELKDDFKIAINLSQVQIQDSYLIPFIREKINEYRIQPHFVEFEVTESIIMKYPENAIKVLKELKELGFSIALDDFGTGYSSLNYLKIIPLDVVKIDKSFIDDISKDERNERIIEKMIELAHSLDLKVVAEGVEEENQVNYLKSVGCDIIQGYYFSKPLSFKELLDKI